MGNFRVTGVNPLLIKDILYLSNILLSILTIVYHLSVTLIHIYICTMG